MPLEQIITRFKSIIDDDEKMEKLKELRKTKNHHGAYGHYVEELFGIKKIIVIKQTMMVSSVNHQQALIKHH
jgi:hypothetical protein